MGLRMSHRADDYESVPRFLDIWVAEQDVMLHAIDLSERIPNRRYRCHIKATFPQQSRECDPNSFLIFDE
jgi:hypothetical protein